MTTTTNTTPPSPKSRRPRPRRRRPVVADTGYVMLTVHDAAPRLGFPSEDAFWAHLRRHEVDRRVDLGGGVVAYRRGRSRRWVIRIPTLTSP